MRTRSLAACLVIVVASTAQDAAAAQSCDSLTSLRLPDAVITNAVPVQPGAFRPSSTDAANRAYARLPAFCRVVLVSQPSHDSEINIEVWLPLSGWNGKYQAVGAGGIAGAVPFDLMAPALAAGYAASGTDTGHRGNNAGFMPAHPERLIDFAYRSTHVMAVDAKTILRSFYGANEKFSYYNACSGGGRHALTSAERFPDDFDGIVAGAASWDQARLDAARIGVNLVVNRSAETRIPASKYRMVHDAVLQACDGLDGVRDGVIENPMQCSFDYSTLACKNGDAPSCLTLPQVESAKTLTSPFKDPVTGKVLFEPHLLPGTEMQWATVGGPEPLENSVDRVRNFHLKDPQHQFTVDTIGADVERADRMDDGLIASRDFNLQPFFARGGKLLMWHGWDDPQVPAQNSVRFYQSVMRTVGPKAADSITLFMLPGVLHCGRGPGPDDFDKMAAMERWVESGQKPTRLTASHLTNGVVDRTRPLCPFGQSAKWNGSGSTDDAASFSCGPSTALPGSR